MLVSLLVVLVMVALATISLVLHTRLTATELELERSQRRMARLDEIVNEIVSEELLAQLVREVQDPPPIPKDARWVPIGLEFDSESLLEDDEELVPPRMTVTVREVRRQTPSRLRYETPVVTPRKTLPPGERVASIVEVGSIQLRSDELTRE